MNFFADLMLVISILSLLILLLLAPFMICDYFFGRERAERFAKRFYFNMRCETLDVLCILLFFIVFLTLAVRHTILK